MSKASVYEAKTESFIQPILDSMNFELVDVEYVKEGGMNYQKYKSQDTPAPSTPVLIAFAIASVLPEPLQ